MALTPIFWSKVAKEHGSRGLLLALGLALILSAILYLISYYIIPNYFELPMMTEAVVGYVIMVFGLIIFFVLYWKFVVKKS